MLPINFEDLARQHPEYRTALMKLRKWMSRHEDETVINPMIVARELRDIDAVTLARVLMLLVAAGFLRRVYKVLTPAGVLAEGEFEDPTLIPGRLADRFEHYFDTTEADVIPVFRRAA